MFIDTHCHLQHIFENNLDNINSILSKLSTEFNYIIDLSVNIKEILNSLNFNYPKNILYSYGLYPDQAKYFDNNMKNEFYNIIKYHRPYAIGEIGIDLYWDYGTVIEQEKLFRFQIEVACEFDLPIIIHSRNSFNDTYRILCDYKSLENKVIMHCFSYNWEEAKKLIDKSFYISFAGNLTYKNALNIQKTAKNISLDRVLLETDSPYLSPVPLRGKKNYPENIKYIYEYFSNLRNLPIDETIKLIEKNLKNIFF